MLVISSLDLAWVKSYKSSNGEACGDGGDRACADVAGCTAAGCEGGEDEGDVVEGGLWGSFSWGWKLLTLFV